MDVKTSARAKHASSQRGRARHSTRKHQPPLQQQQQQQVASDLQQPQKKKDLQLPSNWSRYDDEEEKEQSHFDVPPVKSKGANYKDLLSEKSMLQGPVTDMASGRKGLMVTRGLDLWSRFTDMDNLWSKHEGAGEEDNFFTLDLDFLNEELAKLDIAQRLLLDPEYGCLGKSEKSERVHKIPEAEPVDEDKAILTLPSRTSAMKSQALVSPQGIDGLDRSVLTGNEEPGGGSVVDARLLKESGATSKLTGDYDDSFPSKESEIPDGSMYSVSKEPLAQLLEEPGATSKPTGNYTDSFPNKESEIPDGNMPSVSKEPLAKTTNLFDTKSAEAELDALLDMLDIRTAEQAPNLMSIDPPGLARGPSVSAFEGAYPDALQESSPLDFFVDSSHGATLNPDVGAPNNSPLHMMRSTNSAVKANRVSFNVPGVDTGRSVPNLDEEFDEWLDSL